MAHPINEALFSKAKQWVFDNQLIGCEINQLEVIWEARQDGFTDKDFLEPSFWLGVIRGLSELMLH